MPDHIIRVATILFLIGGILYTFPYFMGINPSILTVIGGILENLSMLLLLFAPAQDSSAKPGDPLRVAVVMLLLMVFVPYVLLCLMGLTVPLFIGIIAVVSEILALLTFLFALDTLSDPSDQDFIDQDTTEE